MSSQSCSGRQLVGWMPCCGKWITSRWTDLDARRVTAGSQSPGIGRVFEVTKGHQPGRFRIREDVTGVCRTPEDTSSPRFGTVRPRVQIPGPRPFLYSESAISEVVWSRRITAGSQFPGEPHK